MSVEILDPNQLARLVGSKVTGKEESEVHVQPVSPSFAQSMGRTDGTFYSSNMMVAVYIVVEGEVTNIRVSFPMAKGLSFEFPVFNDEATVTRVSRYLDHYMERHNTHLSMMSS